ncbi:transposase [Pseudomonas sp. S60]|nr:transposase [Pseudomonas sp. S60]
MLATERCLMTRRQQAQRDISLYLMDHYNWIRPHQFNHGLAPAKAEEKLKTVSEIS